MYALPFSSGPGRSIPGLALAGLLLMGLAMPAARAEGEDQVAQAPQMQSPDRDRCARLADRLGRIDRKLTADQVRDILAGRLAESGETNLKVGKVRAKDGGVVAADIVTASGSLVVTREISTKTGLPADMLDRCRAMRAQRAAMAGPDAPDGHRGPGMRGGLGERTRGPMGGGMGDAMRGGLPGAMALVGDAGPGRDLKLTADQARKLADAALVIAGNPRLKVGTVKEKDADTLTVDIVTQDNALVLRREVDRHSGRFKRAA